MAVLVSMALRSGPVVVEEGINGRDRSSALLLLEAEEEEEEDHLDGMTLCGPQTEAVEGSEGENRI